MLVPAASAWLNWGETLLWLSAKHPLGGGAPVLL